METKIVAKIWLDEGQMWVQEVTFHLVRSINPTGEDGYIISRTEYHDPRMLKDEG